MSAPQDFADLRFRIECSQMVLTKAGGDPIILRGPGEVWQDAEGVLQYKIFTDQAGYRGLQDYARRPGVIGQLIPDDEFFNLEAREYDMAQWTAQRSIPSYRGGLQEGLAYGHVHELVHTEAIPANRQQDFVLLRLKGKLEFPCNEETYTEIRIGGKGHRLGSSLNVALVEDGDYRFKVFYEGAHTVVSLRLPVGQLTSATPFRLREALQFILAQQIPVMVVEISTAGQHIIRLTSPAKGHGKMPPPLMFGPLDQGGHVWRMFTSYFRHIHPNAEPGWHPISRHVGSTVESAAASLDAEVLALAVAVEGLAGETFPHLAPANPAFLTELDSVQSTLRTVKLTEATWNRIKGSLNAMRRPRNSDVLRAFLSAHRLPAGLYDSWSRLRNTSAHGGGAGDRDIETILRLKNEVLSLLYSLVFAAINYTGPRTDYSLPGWPTQTWPIPPPPTAAPPSVVPPAPAVEPQPQTSIEQPPPANPAGT
jgi:hypothetical protein